MMMMRKRSFWIALTDGQAHDHHMDSCFFLLFLGGTGLMMLLSTEKKKTGYDERSKRVFTHFHGMSIFCREIYVHTFDYHMRR